MKNILIKGICIFLVLTMVLNSYCRTTVNANIEHNDSDDLMKTLQNQQEYYTNPDNIIASVGADVYQRMLDQEDALKAYNYFCENVLTDDFGNISYPENYAGEYIDGDTLVILSTDVSDLDDYRNFLSSFQDSVSFIEVDYSLSDLQIYANEIMYDEELISYYTFSPKENSIVFYVESNQLDKAIQNHNKNNIPVEFKEIVEETDAINLYGGQTISNGTNYFTLGFCGSWNGRNAIITCGHGQSMPSDLIYNGVDIGEFTYIQRANNEYYDYAVATVTNANYNLTSIVKGSSTNITVAGEYSAPVGTLLFRYGSYSGGIEAIEVEELNYSSTVDSVTIKGITKCTYVSGVYTIGGDSLKILFSALRRSNSVIRLLDFLFPRLSFKSSSRPDSYLVVYFRACVR